jgi:hypothetical protein
MNSAAVYAAPQPVLEKRFVSSMLLAMLFIVIGMTFVTVFVGDEDAMLNTAGFLALLGPIAMFLLAWLGADTQVTKTSEVRSGESRVEGYFPAWLGRR